MVLRLIIFRGVLITYNEVRLMGKPTAIYIMPGLVNKQGSRLIQNNHCRMSAQFGVAFADFDRIPNWAGDELNQGNSDLFQSNSFNNVTADQAGRADSKCE